MKKSVILILLIFIVGFIIFSAAASEENLHPKLFVDYEDISDIKEKINSDEKINYIFYDDGNGAIKKSDNALDLDAYYLFYVAKGMHYMNRLASAYLFSDDADDYGEKCKELTLYAKDYNSDMSCDGPDNYFDESLVLYTLNIGYDFCYDKFIDEEKKEIRNRIVEYVDSAVDNCQFQIELPSVPNKNAMTAGMLGLSYVNIYDEVDASQKNILESGKLLSDNILEQNLFSHSFGEDGSFSEGILYLMWSYKFLIPYFEAREKYDGYSFYDEYPRLKESIKWIVYNMVPEGNGKTNDFNDARLSQQPLRYHNTYLDWIIHKEKNSEYSKLGRWAWEHVFGDYSGYSDLIMNSDVLSMILWFDSDVSIENPSNYLDNSGYFSDGWYFYRTGWQDEDSSDDIMFQFYSGKFYGGHNQADKNQYTLYEGDSYFLKDSGYSSPEYGQPYYTVSYHNLILVNEVGQITQTSGCGSDGKIDDYFYSSGLDFLIGDNSFAYNEYSEYIVENDRYGFCWFDSANPVLKSERNVLVIKDFNGKPYFLILDDIQKDDGLNNYKLFFQHQNSSGDVNIGDEISVSHNSRTLDINFINPLIGDLSHIANDENDKNKITKAYMNDIVNPYFIYALIPHDNSNVVEYFDEGYGFSLSNGNLKDIILIDSDYSGVESDAKFVYLRYIDDVLKEFYLGEGTSLVVDGVDYVSSEKISSVYSDGTNVYLSEKNIDYEIYGSDVENVYVDRDGYSFNLIDDYVYPYFSSGSYKKCVDEGCIDFYGDGEDECNVDSDCSLELICGDSICDSDEDCDSCPEDCGECPIDSCGNDICDSNENCSSCLADCGDCQEEEDTDEDVYDNSVFYIIGGVLTLVILLFIILYNFVYNRFRKTKNL